MWLNPLCMKHFILLFFAVALVACGKTTENTNSNESGNVASAPVAETPHEVGAPEADSDSDSNDAARTKANPSEGFPFGYNLDDWTPGKVSAREGGDCWGSKRNYSQGEMRMVLDSGSCGEYGSTNTYYLFQGEDLIKVHLQEANVDFEASGDEGNYICSDKIYSFEGEATLASRSQRMGYADFASMDAAFSEEPLKDAESLRKRLKREGEAVPRPEPEYYICYKADGGESSGLMIGFTSDGKAIWAQYEGEGDIIELDFQAENMETGTAYPVTEGHYLEMVDGENSGEYKLTHSGNYDYAEYTRAKDGKVFNFTIDFDASVVGDGYSEMPCY